MRVAYIIMLMLCFPLAFAMDECTRSMQTDALPCVIITPSLHTNCSLLSIDFYYMNATVPDKRIFDTYGNTGRCNTTFNYTVIGNYLFNQSNGDTGDIIVGDESMSFYNILFLSLFYLIGFFFIYLMHKFEERNGLPMVYGIMAAIFFIIPAMMVFMGFQAINSLISFGGINVNIYVAIISCTLALYCTTFSIGLYKQSRPKASEYEPN